MRVRKFKLLGEYDEITSRGSIWRSYRGTNEFVREPAQNRWGKPHTSTLAVEKKIEESRRRRRARDNKKARSELLE
jgi:hypothetical protein